MCILVVSCRTRRKHLSSIEAHHPLAGTSTLDPAHPRSRRMSDDNDQTKPSHAEFDFSVHPHNALIHERRTGRGRRREITGPPEAKEPTPPCSQGERRVKKDRRRRIDPTTFEKQYTDAALDFINAMQRFKESSGTSFPTHGDVLKRAAALGYRRRIVEREGGEGGQSVGDSG